MRFLRNPLKKDTEDDAKRAFFEGKKEEATRILRRIGREGELQPLFSLWESERQRVAEEESRKRHLEEIKNRAREAYFEGNEEGARSLLSSTGFGSIEITRFFSEWVEERERESAGRKAAEKKGREEKAWEMVEREATEICERFKGGSIEFDGALKELTDYANKAYSDNGLNPERYNLRKYAEKLLRDSISRRDIRRAEKRRLKEKRAQQKVAEEWERETRKGGGGGEDVQRRLEELRRRGGPGRPPTIRRRAAERKPRGDEMDIDRLMAAGGSGDRGGYPPREGGGGYGGRPGGGGGGPAGGGPGGGSYYEDNIKSERAAKKFFFAGYPERAVEILREIGWDDGKIRNALEKWKKEYEVLETAEKAYYEGDTKSAAEMLKSQLGWSNELIRKALKRWEGQYRAGRTMVTEERMASRTSDGKIDFETEAKRLKEHIEKKGVQTSFMPKEASKKFFAKSSPSGKVVMDYLEELWEATIEKS